MFQRLLRSETARHRHRDAPFAAGMSRFLLNIAKRSLPRLTLRGVGLASKNAVC